MDAKKLARFPEASRFGDREHRLQIVDFEMITLVRDIVSGEAWSIVFAVRARLAMSAAMEGACDGNLKMSSIS